MTCPACGKAHTLPLVPYRVRLAGGTRIRTTIRACTGCSHRFLAATSEDQRAIEASYDHEYAGFRPDPIFARRVREELQANLVRRCPPPARVLDVGCGNGEFLRAAAQQGYRAEGIDVSPAAVAMCNRDGLSAQVADFRQWDARPYEMITMWDVVEHLREPSTFLRHARELITPAGILVLKVPAFGILSFPPIFVSPRVANAVLGAPSHVQYFTQRSLRTLLGRAGFDDLEWLGSRAFRGVTRGGSLKKRLARAGARAIAGLARNRGLFVIARGARA